MLDLSPANGRGITAEDLEKATPKPRAGDIVLIWTNEAPATLDEFVLDHFGLSAPPPDLDCWRALTQRARDAAEVVRIAIVGKYVELEDAYLSVAEALRHAGFQDGCGIEIDWVDWSAIAQKVTRRGCPIRVRTATVTDGCRVDDSAHDRPAASR